MDAYIRSLINSATGGLRSAIDAVTGRITSVWTVLTGFFGSVHTAETRLRTGIDNWINAQLRHASAIATTLRWLATVYVPNRILVAVTSIETWTSSLINEARALAASEVQALKQWAIGEINNVINEALAFTGWVQSQLSAVIGRIARIEATVGTLLGAPERLAAWLVGAMVTAIIGYASDHAEAIGRNIWARRQTVGLAAAHWIEDLILKII